MKEARVLLLLTGLLILVTAEAATTPATATAVPTNTTSNSTAAETTIIPTTLTTTSTTTTTTSRTISTPVQMTPICKNGGQYDGTKCVCPEMFYGSLCENTIDRLPPPICKNGGQYDGTKCVCPEMFYGSLCENTIDRLPPVMSINTTVTVELRIINQDYTESLTDPTSNEYIEFETQFKTQMNTVYSSIPGYKDVTITRIMAGSIIVDHDVIVEIEYKTDVTVETQYKEIFQDITTKVEIAKSETCSADASDCLVFDKDYGEVKENDIPVIDACSGILSGFKDFYFEQVTSDGLTCISFCDPLYDKYKPCNGGRCVIQEKIGPQCLCPWTDLYMYTSPYCSGKISIVALFAGLGAAFGVLLIVIITLSVVITNQKKSGGDHNDSLKRYDQRTAQHTLSNVSLQKGQEANYSNCADILPSKSNPYLRQQTQSVGFSNNMKQTRY